MRELSVGKMCVLCIAVRWEAGLSGSLLKAYHNSCVGQEGMPGMISTAGVPSGGGCSIQAVFLLMGGRSDVMRMFL